MWRTELLLSKVPTMTRDLYDTAFSEGNLLQEWDQLEINELQSLLCMTANRSSRYRRPFEQLALRHLENPALEKRCQEGYDTVRATKITMHRTYLSAE